MKDCIEPDMAYKRLHRALVADVDLEESRTGRHCFPGSGREVIDNRD
jgi:hypothetical protein